MTHRKSEDVEITGVCQNDNCENTGVTAIIEGRYNAIGEFEAFDEDDLLCIYCSEPLCLEQ